MQYSRRTTLGLLAGTVTAMVTPSFALTEPQAVTLVRSVVREVQDIINSKGSDKKKIKKFEKLFGKYGDTYIMGRYVLGVEARGMSRDELNDFANAFMVYMANKYGKRFREFAGGSVEIKRVRKIKAGYEVITETKTQGYDPFEVSYLVSDKSGSPRFFNMMIEGINLLLTERSEIQAMLDQRGGNLQRLISDLKAT